MAGFMKSAMSYLGMTDVAEGDEDFNEEAESSETSFDSDHSVTRWLRLLPRRPHRVSRPKPTRSKAEG